jgi:hypothetical protein
VGTTCGLGPAAPLSVEVLPCSVRSVRCAARLLYARRREGGRRKEKKSNGRKRKEKKKIKIYGKFSKLENFQGKNRRQLMKLVKNIFFKKKEICLIINR